MDLFIAETSTLRVNERLLSRVVQLRAEMESLRKQAMRDGFVLEQLSLKTKTPYVQLTLTKRFLPNVQVQAAGASPAGALAGGTESAAGGLDATASATGAGVTSALADATSDAMSRPPM